jgi:serine/threonine protein kinase
VDICGVVEATVWPEALGHLTLLDVLGAGVYGAVLRVHDRRSRRDRALKFTTPYAPILCMSCQTEFALQLRGAEAGFAVRPDKAELFVWDGAITYAITMEEVDGTLGSAFKCARSVPELRRLARRLNRLLHELHTFRFTHGDLHLDNIAVRGEELLLLDFGFASFDVHMPAVDFAQLLRSLFFARRASFFGSLGLETVEEVVGLVLDNLQVPELLQSNMHDLSKLTAEWNQLLTVYARSVQKQASRQQPQVVRLEPRGVVGRDVPGRQSGSRDDVEIVSARDLATPPDEEAEAPTKVYEATSAPIRRTSGRDTTLSRRSFRE